MRNRGHWPVIVGVAWLLACRAFDAEQSPQPGSDAGASDAGASEAGASDAGACGPAFVLDQEVASTPCSGGCDDGECCRDDQGAFACQSTCPAERNFECLGRRNYCLQERCCLKSSNVGHCQADCDGPELCTDSGECGPRERCVRQTVGGHVFGVCTKCP